MKLKKSGLLIVVAAAMGAAMPAAAFATDGTITFTGNVIANTCKISGNGGGPNFTVTLRDVSAGSFPNGDGDFAMREPFNIALTQCNPDSGTASVYFEPDGFVDSATGQLRNVNGTATNIEIGLLNSNESKIQLGAESASQNSQSVPITSGSATLTYYAQYVRQGGVPTVGSVRTATQYTIIYQ